MHMLFRIGKSLGEWIGWFLGSFIRYRKKEVMATLRLCFPEKPESELKSIADGMYRNIGLNIVEWSRLPSIDEDFVHNNIEIENLERFNQTLARGNGIIILSAHIGNFILMCISAGVYKAPFHVISKRIRPEWMHRRWDAVYARFGVKTLPRRNSYRDCRKVLKNREALGFVLDQNMKRKEGVFVSFFGRPACTSPGLAFLSANCQSPVVPVFTFRKPDGRHKIIVMNPIEPPTDRKPETIQNATQLYTSIIEQAVREHPEQWIWIHRRWRTQPA